MTTPDPAVAGISPTPADRHLVDARAQWIGVAMYLVVALLFAVNGSVTKAVIEAGLGPVRVTETRNAGALLVLLAIILVVRPSSLRLTRAEVPFLALYGFIAFALTQFLYFVTISRLPIGIGTLLTFLAPVLVAVWLRFGRRHRVDVRVWWALGLTLIGLALVSQIWAGITLDTVGLIAGLATAGSLALYWLLGESGGRRRDPLSLTFWGFAFATLAWSVIAPWWSYPVEVMTRDAVLLPSVLPPLPVWVLVVWMVVLGTVVPFLLVVASLQRIGAQRAGIIGTTEPVWATIVAFWLLGETVLAVQIIGGAVVLAGIWLAETSARRHGNLAAS